MSKKNNSVICFRRLIVEEYEEPFTMLGEIISYVKKSMTDGEEINRQFVIGILDMIEQTQFYMTELAEEE